MGSGALYAAARRRPLFAALLAALALVALTVSACLTYGAGTSADAGPSHATPPSTPATPSHPAPIQAAQHPAQEVPAAAGLQTEPGHHCPDQGPPVPACQHQADLQLGSQAAGPRPDADLLWDHPRYAAERAGLPGSPFADPAPDLIALSISRT